MTFNYTCINILLIRCLSEDTCFFEKSPEFFGKKLTLYDNKGWAVCLSFQVCQTWFLIPIMFRLPRTSREPTCILFAVLQRRNVCQGKPHSGCPILASFYLFICFFTFSVGWFSCCRIKNVLAQKGYVFMLVSNVLIVMIFAASLGPHRGSVFGST